MTNKKLSELEIKKLNSQSINNSKFALTTIDNPYDPFVDFTNWLLFDNINGYNTCGYLAKFARTSDSLSESENQQEIERAIDEIIKFNPLGLYKKAVNPNFIEETY